MHLLANKCLVDCLFFHLFYFNKWKEPSKRLRGFQCFFHIDILFHCSSFIKEVKLKVLSLKIDWMDLCNLFNKMCLKFSYRILEMSFWQCPDKCFHQWPFPCCVWILEILSWDDKSSTNINFPLITKPRITLLVMLNKNKAQFPHCYMFLFNVLILYFFLIYHLIGCYFDFLSKVVFQSSKNRHTRYPNW